VCEIGGRGIVVATIIPLERSGRPTSDLHQIRRSLTQEKLRKMVIFDPFPSLGTENMGNTEIREKEMRTTPQQGGANCSASVHDVLRTLVPDGRLILHLIV